MNRDAEHLRLLSIFHYVLAGLTALFACIPVLHVVLGFLMAFAPQVFDGRHGHDTPPAILGVLFMAFGGLAIAIGWASAVLLFLGGRFLAARKHPTFCFVVACVSCLWMPLGTVLGVFTIVVLSRDSVKGLFATQPVAPPAG